MKSLLIAIMVILSICAEIHAESTIRFRVREAPPAYIQNGNGEWTGFVVEQAKALLNKAECRMVFINMPWKRALVSLEEGSLDMLGNMSINDEREKYTKFIGPHRFEKMKLIVTEQSHFPIHRHEDLKQIPGKISLVRGLWYGEKMALLLNDPDFTNKINWVSGNQLVLQETERLRLGRVKGIIYPEFFIKDMTGVKYHPFTIHSNPVYFGLSRESIDDALFNRLNDAANDLIKTGTFEKIEAKFH